MWEVKSLSPKRLILLLVFLLLVLAAIGLFLRIPSFLVQTTADCEQERTLAPEPIWQPGQGREELATLIALAQSGDTNAAWDLHRAIHFCFGIPDSDRDLRRAIERLGGTEPESSVSEHGELIEAHGQSRSDPRTEELRRRFQQCKDVPRAPGTAYDWLYRAAAGGQPKAQLVFHQQGLRYVRTDLKDRAVHLDRAMIFLRQRIDAGDGRALPRLAQIKEFEAAISGRDVTPDPIEVHALYLAASLYAEHDDRLEDWRPAWETYLKMNRNKLTTDQLQEAERLAQSYLGGMTCGG